MIAEQSRDAQIKLREWWKWQTRSIQVLVSTPDVRVQVPPRAPKALNSSEFRAFLLSAMVLRIYSLILPYGNAGWARPRGNLFFGKEGRHEA